MIIKQNTDPTIEQLKAKAHITGDVYLINGHLMESLDSHNRTFGCDCHTIEEAETHRLAIIEEERKRCEEMAEENEFNPE